VKGEIIMPVVGSSTPRKEAQDKVTGRAKYNDDITLPGISYVAVKLAERAHARIDLIDTQKAREIPGVQAIITGGDTTLLCGEVLADRPPIARDVVRYWGEPVALVVASNERVARQAAAAIRVVYIPLPVVNAPHEALRPNAPLIHPNLAHYVIAQNPVYPEAGTNIADHARVRKGDMTHGWAQAEEVVVVDCHLPQIDHAAMETRSTVLEILPDGRVLVHSSSQAPFEVQKTLAQYFHLDQGQVVVTAPLVGGAFGGKAAIQLEILAYLASQAIGGRAVKLANPREQDMAMSPVGMGLDAHIRLGATRDGELVAADITFLMDIGAYTDSAPRVARAIAAQCTGPYHVPNVTCDVLAVYTNHTYTTAFRGFGHMPMTFAIERAVDKLAEQLDMDPLILRRRNALRPGATSPTQARLTESNLGNLPACLDRLQELLHWPGPRAISVGPDTVRTQGIAAFWKTSSSPPNAVSGAIVTMNQDGTVNLSTGAVEFGPGTKTTAAQILAERLHMNIDHIYIHVDVNTQTDPEHWKTVASLSTYMVGRAVSEAAEDLIQQLKNLGAIALRCSPSDLMVANETVYLRDDPSILVKFSDIAHGFKFKEGDTIGGQRIGRGSFVIRHLNLLDEESGEGRPGPGWTVGAQGVEIEFRKIRI
jgi:CO/xanthine dehydrogenase Mo-binding subunit